MEAKKMIYKRIIVCFTTILIYLIFNSALANNQQPKKRIAFPVGCKQMGYKFDLYNVIFKPSTKKYSQTIYFIQNRSTRIIHLLHVNDPYTMHINGNIYPNKWSVLAVSEQKIKYICSIYNKQDNYHHILHCKNVLDICEFPRAKFGTNHRGTYWLTLNKSQKSAVRKARFHGILLTDPKQMKNND